MEPMPAQPLTNATTCERCGSTVFVQKRGKLATVFDLLLLFVFIIPGLLVLWLAPKHTCCARKKL